MLLRREPRTRAAHGRSIGYGNGKTLAQNGKTRTVLPLIGVQVPHDSGTVRTELNPGFSNVHGESTRPLGLL